MSNTVAKHAVYNTAGKLCDELLIQLREHDDAWLRDTVNGYVDVE